MAVLGPGSPAKIIFMEGFDGANDQTGDEQASWTHWRLWHTASHDLPALSPSIQTVLTGTLQAVYYDGTSGTPTNHTPGNLEYVGGWYAGDERSRSWNPKAPTWNGNPEIGESKCGLMWRTGSGNDINNQGGKNGFQDIIDGSTGWLGFAFCFPDDGAGNMCSGKIKVWMGDALQNGLSNTGVIKYTPDDPGEPNRTFTGETAAASEYQQGRLALEISSVGTTGVQNINNVLLYRTAIAAGPNTQPAWSHTGSLEILADQWYWGVWEVLPVAAPTGRSVFYVGSSTVPVVSAGGENCRDTQASEIISNLTFALRGLDQDVGNFGGTYIAPLSARNQILIDDIVLFHDKRPAETFCVILSSSAVLVDADKETVNFTPVNASSMYTAVSESQIHPRIPLSASWDTTIDVTNRLNVTYAGFPTYSAGVTPSDANTLIYGVQSMALCARDNSDFRFAHMSMSSDAGLTEALSKRVVQPGQGHHSQDKPFVYISSKIWPTSSVGGSAWSMADINSLTGSVSLQASS